MPKGKYKLASLFSGCGGIDLGFVWEGFKVEWANDYDHWACETYRNYFGDHIVEGDITNPSEVDLKVIPDVDVIAGGFPCQDFSMLWKRGGINTERGNLYRYFVDTVRDKKPKVFIAENVKGLLTANKGKAIRQIVRDFAAAGFVATPHLVDFANYGVPQHRHRVIIVGVRKDIPLVLDIPDPTHGKGAFMTASEALRGVKKVRDNNERMKISEHVAKRLELIPPGGNFTDIPKDSPFYVKGMISHVYRRLHPDKPSTTIIAGGGGGTWGYHYKEPRPLTNRERARLFGYPDDFLFLGSISEVRRQIGNSVPPAGIRPFARAIREFLENLE